MEISQRYEGDGAFWRPPQFIGCQFSHIASSYRKILSEELAGPGSIPRGVCAQNGANIVSSASVSPSVTASKVEKGTQYAGKGFGLQSGGGGGGGFANRPFFMLGHGL